MLRWFTVFALACSVTVAHAQRKVQSNGFSYSVAKVPAWVEPPPSSAAGWSGHSSVRYVLADSQVNLTGALPVRYTGVRVAAADQTGLPNASEIHIRFNPVYETLTLHEIGVTRAGRRTDKLPKIKLELLQRETRLEKSVYDGLVTAFAVIDDVRVGDVVDYSFSVRGANPIFGGKFSDSYTLNAVQPTDARRVRLEYPARRAMSFKVLGMERSPVVKVKGSNSVMELVVAGQAPIVPEDKTAHWIRIPYPELQVSEYADWAQVEAWALQHYQIPEQLSPELLQVVERIRSESKSPEEAVSRTLAFVQDEIRYFAVETGTNSHKPSPPDETFARRYGDCKDKSVLTIALLQRLGVRAHPALVSTSYRGQVANGLPSPLAFDHVITLVEVNSGTFWIDPTRSYQGRSIPQLGFEPFDRALVIGARMGQLAEVKAPPEYAEAINMTERFLIKKYSAPFELTVIRTLKGMYAERLRAYLASKDSEAYGNDLENNLKRRYPGLRRLRVPEIADNRQANEITVTESYELANLFSYANGRVTGSLWPSEMVNFVQAPATVNRSTPMALPFPTAIVQRFELQVPLELLSGVSQPVSITTPQFAFAYRASQRDRTLAMEFELRFLRNHVAPAEMREYLEGLSKVRIQFERQLRFPLFDPERTQRDFLAAAKSEERRLAKLPGWMRRHLMNSLATRVAVEEAIASGQLEGKDLASAWLEVALERSNSGDRDKALEAIDMALKLQPDLARAFKMRAEVYAYTGRFEDALTEMKRALSPKEEEGSAFSLAQILYFLGRYPEALDSLKADASHTSGPAQTYRLLWVYMAATRAGLDAAEVMRGNGYRAARPDWPGPIAGYLLGEVTEEKLLSSAREDERESAPRLCEAWFFIGQKRLLTGDSAGARSAFEQALSTQIRPYLEYIYSDVELKRMQLGR